MLSIHFIGCKIICNQYGGADTMDVIQNIRKVRMERGYSQIEIANLLNTTQQQYSKYENGQNEIPVRHIITLCRFYQVSADWMLGLKETQE